MLNIQDATPCPIGAFQSSRVYRRSSTTKNLVGTSKVTTSITDAGPRRRTSAAPRSQAADIASDADATWCIATELPIERNWKPQIARSSDVRVAPTRRRVSQLLSRPQEKNSDHDRELGEPIAEDETPNLGKRPRRRTIYISPDDTTVLTIHPGMQTDRLALNDLSLQVEAHQMAAPSIRDDTKVMARKVRRASFAAAPKRMPLQPTLKPLQEVEERQDTFSVGRGKENVPPGLTGPVEHTISKAHHPKARRDSCTQPVFNRPAKRMEGMRSQWYPQFKNKVESVAEVNRHNLLPGRSLQDGDLRRAASHSCRRTSMMNEKLSLHHGTDGKIVKNMVACHRNLASSKMQGTVLGLQREVAKKVGYSILNEDIEKVEMFEDAWLNQQESAIQQLLNDLFEKSDERVPISRSDEQQQHHRRQLLHLYQDTECALTYKRLQASLLYGTLNPPKGSVANADRLNSDVGLRQTFLSAWLDNYDLQVLMPAAEVVVGRKFSSCISSPRSGLARSRENPTKELKRSVRIFLESCLLRNEDVHGTSDPLTPLWCWRRTMLRCLMLVLLLDKAKGCGLVSENLFQPSSSIKSSADMVARLLSLIAPFLGMGARLLSHLHYRVHYRQLPFSEFKYGISNLATDLRDGIQLTRLVELLFHPISGSTAIQQDVGDEMSKNLRDQQTMWPLSRYLNMPCVTQSQKVYNVQIALDSVRGFGSTLGNIAETTCAEDIVAGHREKTVALLWSLVGNFGLEALVNPIDIRKEILRLSKSMVGNEGPEFNSKDESGSMPTGMARHAHLVFQWAKASARCQGLGVFNLTTAFSNGKVFAAIMNEYQQYLPRGHALRCQGVDGLEVKLKDIGCSHTFGKTFCCPVEGITR